MVRAVSIGGGTLLAMAMARWRRAAEAAAADGHRGDHRRRGHERRGRHLG